MAANKSGEKTKEKILAAAQEEFLQNGYEKTTVEEIARKAGVTKMMLYYHFSTKQNMLNEMMNKLVMEIKTELRANMTRMDLNDPAQFRAHVQGMLNFYQQRQALIRLIVLQSIDSADAHSLAPLKEIFEVVIALNNNQPGPLSEEQLVGLFFFNALPMAMYSLLADGFCADFGIPPERSQQIFMETFVRVFANEDTLKRSFPQSAEN